MKVTLVRLAAVVLFVLPAYSQQPLTPEQKKGAEEVMATMSKWAAAVVARDTKALDQIFAEDLFVTLPDGKTRRKAEEMKALEPNPAVRMLSVANEDVEIRMLGDAAAIVTAVTKMRLERDKAEVPVTLRSTSAFAKRDGRWQLVVLQIAYVSQPPANAAAPTTKQ